MHCIYCGMEIADEVISQPVCDACFFNKREEILRKGQMEFSHGFSDIGMFEKFEIPIAYFIYSDRSEPKKEVRFRKSKRLIRSE